MGTKQKAIFFTTCKVTDKSQSMQSEVIYTLFYREEEMVRWIDISLDVRVAIIAGVVFLISSILTFIKPSPGRYMIYSGNINTTYQVFDTATGELK